MSLKQSKRVIPAGQIDERTIMFSRKLLEPGSLKFEQYYNEFPEHRSPDDKFREKPGLLSEEATLYDPVTFNAARSIFDAITSFHPGLDNEPESNKIQVKPQHLSSFIREWIMKEGAHSVGFTETHDYHWYSIIGRGKDYGKAARLPHSHAIAFTVEMDKELMDTAPLGPTVMESARQYMHAAVISVEVAGYLRELGYQARAHIDGNYRVVCPLVARDAGLGEIGRMGLLMTPKLGPRVRIGVVTTDFPFPVSEPAHRPDMIDFCRICKKCAEVCPSKAIPFDDRDEIDGIKRWQIDQEACYTYWCITGTDCGKCMSDCPYSHPDNLFHNLVRFMIRRSSVFRRLAVKLDDVFYGRKPKSKPVPKWLRGHPS